jgi:hypothetical protein
VELNHGGRTVAEAAFQRPAEAGKHQPGGNCIRLTTPPRCVGWPPGRGNVAYHPLLNLTRGEVPRDAFYEVRVLSPAEGVRPTTQSSLGTICGDRCTFIFHDGTTCPLPEEANRLQCGGKRGLTNSTVTNYTAAQLMLSERLRNCVINSVGPVEDRGRENSIIQIMPDTARGK